MATLPGQRSTFTWALREFNKSDDPDQKAKFAKHMANALGKAFELGVPKETISQNQDYPDEVNNYLGNESLTSEPTIPEEQAAKIINDSVDTSNVIEIGMGSEFVYAYGYACCPDRLKIGSTKIDVVQRIAAQIYTSTPDKPVLLIKIKTANSMALERAIHATLEIRNSKIQGGGTEWFKTNCEEILAIHQFITQSQ